MKRLLVLFIVFAMTSAAEAALSFYINDSPAPSSITINTDEHLSIQIYSSDTSSWFGYLVADGVGRFYEPPSGIPRILAGTGATGDIAPWGEPNVVELFTGTDPQQGIQFVVDYESSEVGSARIGLFFPPDYSWDGDEIDRIDVTVVPEPVTMSLLALGGALVLIRKRRA